VAQQPRVKVSPDDSARRLHAEIDTLRDELEAARRLIVQLEAETRGLREELTQLHTSAAGRMTMRLQQGARRIAPYGTRRQDALHRVAQSAAVLVEQGPRALVNQVARRADERRLPGSYPDTPGGRLRQYRDWLRQHEPDKAALTRLHDVQDEWSYQPVVSLLMPVRDPKPDWLEEAIASVTAQIYERWELCIADDGSSDAAISRLLDRFASADGRVRVRRRPRSGGIAAATNDALELATGEWVGFIDHDDVLRPHALHAMVSFLQSEKETDVCYSDEDKLLPSGGRGDPLFKPDWSPEMLLSSNYITHFVLVRKTLIEPVGGLRLGFDGSQDHDLLLRVTERARHVGHVADVLYSWRMVPGSAALSSDYKPLAREAGRRAVQDALTRRRESGAAEFGKYPGFYDVKYTIDGAPSVAIIIPTRDHLELLRAVISSVEGKTTYPNYKIIIVNNQSRQRATLDYFQTTPHQVIDVDQPFNFSAIINVAAAATEADHLLLVNNDVTVNSPGWIEAMLAHSQKPDVGAVGARLVYSDGHVQHEGIAIGRLHVAANMETKYPGVREVSAVTGACLMTRRSVFTQLDGFDEQLAEAFNDVDYCLRARSAGYRVIITPLAELTHREGGSRGRRTPELDRAYFVKRWGDVDEIEDPYLNRNVLWPNPFILRFD
jgi:O-antigen biosynthesis protein